MTAKVQLLLGDNPFNGVDHFSQERSRLRRSLGTTDIINIISAAVESGATGFTFSATPKMLEVLRNMRDNGFPEKLNLYPVIPDVGSYFQLISERGTRGALMAKLAELSSGSKVRSMLNGGLGLMTRDPVKILRAYVTAEASIIEASLPAQAQIEGLFLHEIGTDLMVSLGMTGLFDAYCRVVVDSLNVVPGFVTRNFPRFVKFVQSNNFELKEYLVLTPLNRLGFQMNPNRQDCEGALGAAKEATVIAMSILAGGYLNLEDAADYISHLNSAVSCVVGVSSTAHAKETFGFLRRRLLDA